MHKAVRKGRLVAESTLTRLLRRLARLRPDGMLAQTGGNEGVSSVREIASSAVASQGLAGFGALVAT